MEEKQLRDELNKFTGTERFFKSTFRRLLLTEGVHYLREKANCYWFIDIIESYQEQLKDVGFQIWGIKVNKDKTALVYCTQDSNEPNIIEQQLKYTDFPLKEYELYCTDGVVLLKSEY